MGRTKEALALASEQQLAMRSWWDEMLDQAHKIYRSGLAPKRLSSPEAVVVVMLKGLEIGIPPMQALAHIHVLDGKPSMDAELMLAVVYREIRKESGVCVEFVQNDCEACEIRVSDRVSVKGGSVRFTMQDAQRAQLTGKDNWVKYPRAMLRSRAIAEMARKHFPDLIGGMSHTPEELVGDAAVMNEHGEVIDIKYVDKSVDKFAQRLIQPAPAKVIPINEKLERTFPDTPEAWAWLETRMASLSGMQRDVIKAGAVGRKARDIIADIDAAVAFDSWSNSPEQNAPLEAQA